MSTHNICFCREIRKILCGYPLSVAMSVIKFLLLEVKTLPHFLKVAEKVF